MQSGIRIQKVLSSYGILSRRKAEEAIKQKRITVNGELATLGQPIDTRRDIVTLDGKRILFEKNEKLYIMLNKPRGYVTTTDDQHGRKTVIDLLPKDFERVYPIGRLDMNSEGLLLLTNDGNFANNIMHPSGEVPKTYRVTIRGDVTEDQLVQLSVGVILDDGYKTQPATVHVITKEPNRTVLQFTVFEGRNRLIRRMCEAVHLELIRLKRTSIGPVKLGMLQPGKYRDLTTSEVKAIKASVKKAQNRSNHQG